MRKQFRAIIMPVPGTGHKKGVIRETRKEVEEWVTEALKTQEATHHVEIREITYNDYNQVIEANSKFYYEW